MAFGPFALQWRAPSPNPPLPSELPDGISRSSIPTPSGPLELLSSVPSEPTDPGQAPLFFAHGGFGCAEMWVPYMQFFAARGIPCYAMSYRGHGKSWYPGFWRMYFTTRHTMAEDLAAGVHFIENAEAERTGANEKVRVVLVAHSAGGALSQYALSRGMIKVHAFCMFAAVPGFGSFGCFRFWALTAIPNYYYRLAHPKYILVTTKQVKDAFFTSWTPTSVVRSLQRLLSPYESMLWPVQALFKFVTGPDVLSSITGWSAEADAGVSHNMLVLAAEHDVLCTPAISKDAAERYRVAFVDSVKHGKVDGIKATDLQPAKEQGVMFKVVKGVAHHLQNDVEWEKGAQVILEWIEQL